MQNITIGGKKYPIHLGNAAIAKTKKLSGISGEVPPGADLEYTFLLLYCGLEQGYRKAKKVFPFTCWEEISDLLDPDPDAWDAINKAIQEAFPADTGKKSKAAKA